MVKTAYQYASREIIETLMLFIDEENRKYETIFISQKVELCWDDLLSASILKKAMEEELKPACLGKLLADLLDHNVEMAKEFAESLVTSYNSLSDQWRYKAVVAASVLINHADDAGWALIWPAIQQDSEFGKEVIISASHDYFGINKTQKLCLNEDQLADLFTWLAHKYPYNEDVDHELVFTPGPRDSIASFRDSILNRLKQKGTQEACNAIKRIANEFPELDWLKWTLYDAQIVFRQKTWRELRPSDVIVLACNQEARLVQNGDQLLDILMKSLVYLEQRLQGHTPRAIDLWDESWNESGKKADKLYRPRNENRFSDYIKSHLETYLNQKGIIVNREVEIGEGTTRGERIDIHVNALISESDGEDYGDVKAIIEAKGCWNSELSTAMETQLTKRYLKNSDCNHGLYLVGWFNCDQWDNEDPRKKKASKLKIEELREQLNEQAGELSQNDIHVRALVINAALL